MNTAPDGFTSKNSVARINNIIDNNNMIGGDK
jgi:hypothetical protein